MSTPLSTARSSRLVCTTLASMEAVSASQWDAMIDPDQPFLRHAFLHAMEASGSVSADTGWAASHLAVWSEDRLVGALPLYRKFHSYGEYVFDWGWADAFERAGGRYYPKALSAVPYTPVPGRRTLISPDADISAQTVREVLAAGWESLCEREEMSGWHLLFSDTADVEAWLAVRPALIVREGVQFQWRDEGFGDMDGFLATLTSKRRKMIRRERRLVAEQGLTLERLSGDQISAEALAHFYRCYSITYQERGRPPYLNLDFFQRLHRTMGSSMLLVRACLDAQPVACALYFQGETSLYGRYWGSEVDADCLHFEACYYQGIEHCLDNGLTLFDPGTQGEHKLVRGFRPQRVRSLHALTHPGLAEAVERFCDQEGRHVEAYRQAAEEALPFKR